MDETTAHRPAAIALTPILSARYREVDLARIREAAPGSRLVNVSLEGLSDDDLSDVEVLLRGPLPAATFDRLLARCPRLVWVHSATAGVERVLTPAAAERGLRITNARGVFSQPIAEYVIMMILAITRRLPQLLELQRERTWQPLTAREMRDVTIGIVGLGSIGQAIARLALACGSRVIATRRGRTEPDQGTAADEEGSADLASGTGSAGREGPGSPPPAGMDRVLPPDGLPELLAESDFVVLALPLTGATENLIDSTALAHMKPGAWLINVARGLLVDERALVRALEERRIGGAVLDTLRDEPLAPEAAIWSAPNLIITPHTSWSSGRVLDRSVELFCENLRRFRAGMPLMNVVDPGQGY